MDDFLEEILNNPKIIKIIKDKKLSKNQIQEAIPIFIEILEEESQKNDYTTEIIVHKNGMITKALKPSNQKKEEINFNQNHWLQEISLLDKNHVLDKKDLKQGKKIFDFDKNESRKNIRDFLEKNFFLSLKNNEPPAGFYLRGKFGKGKTFFFSALSNFLISRKKSIIFISISELILFLKKGFESGNNKTIDQVKNVDFLFIDSFGSEKMPDWFFNSFFQTLILSRVEKNKTTIFNSNFSFKMLEKEFFKQYSSFASKEKIHIIIEKIKVIAPIEIEIN